VARRLAPWLRLLDQQLATARSHKSRQEWQPPRDQVIQLLLLFVRQMASVDQQRSFLKR
jgi:hypothetical protein